MIALQHYHNKGMSSSVITAVNQTCTGISVLHYILNYTNNVFFFLNLSLKGGYLVVQAKVKMRKRTVAPVVVGEDSCWLFKQMCSVLNRVVM